MRLKVCNYCGKKYEDGNTCECRTDSHNKYSKEYYEKNKEEKRKLNSKTWKDLRKLIIKRDGGMCNRCWVNLNIIETEDLQVHHIKPRSEFPNLMFDPENLITVCGTCNLSLGTKGKLDWDIQKITDYDSPRLF